MDPDATLALIRYYLTRPEEEWGRNLDEFMTLVESLDDWLSRGGFYPRDWEAHRP